jgi:hypothetical protein
MILAFPLAWFDLLTSTTGNHAKQGNAASQADTANLTASSLDTSLLQL